MRRVRVESGRVSQLTLTSSSIHEKTIYGVNVMGAIRKLFSYWFSLKWEENGVSRRLRC